MDELNNKRVLHVIERQQIIVVVEVYDEATGLSKTEEVKVNQVDRIMGNEFNQ